MSDKDIPFYARCMAMSTRIGEAYIYEDLIRKLNQDMKDTIKRLEDALADKQAELDSEKMSRLDAYEKNERLIGKVAFLEAREKQLCRVLRDIQKMAENDIRDLVADEDGSIRQIIADARAALKGETQ